MLKRVKIVATISDKNCSVDFLQSLYDAGMNVVRLNTAHQSPEDALKVIENVRKVSPNIPILVDTKGPEIRTVLNCDSISVQADDLIKISGNSNFVSDGKLMYVSYSDFVEDVPVGTRVLIDDGDIELVVVEKFDEYLLAKATNGGYIKNRKSVNVPGVNIHLSSLSDKDRKFIDFAIDNHISFIAHSFVRNKKDVMDIQDILNKRGSKIKIIAKIENQEGVDNIDEILDHVYGVMVARGDLGIEIPAERIPRIQHYIVDKCIESKKPVIVATQMLHTMIDHPRPTRAEVSDIASAIVSGTDAIMLSGETAYGAYPLEAVQLMSRVASENESQVPPDATRKLVRINNEITAALARSAVRCTTMLPIKAIVVDTITGRTARYLSAFRGNLPVYARCYDEDVMRELALSYGVIAYYQHMPKSRDEYMQDVPKILKKDGYSDSDYILVIGGSFGHARGATFMEICKISDIK